MSSLYSTSLKIELIGTGDQTGVWGGTTNTNLGTAIEQAIVGKSSLVTGDFTANVATLTLTDTNASQTARAFVLDVTATLSAAGTINVPAVQKPYIVFNNTVGGFALTVKVSGLTGVSIPNGRKAIIYNNGTDVEDAITYLSSLTLGSPLPLTSGGTGGLLTTTYGGTGLSSFTAGDLPYYATGTALSKLGIGTNNYVLASNGTAPTWVNPSSVTTGIATNIAGGATGSVPYQSASSTTGFLAIGAANTVLTSSGTAPQYVAQSTLAVGTATNIAGGAANQLVVQSGSGATTFATAPTTVGYVLGWNGSALTWVVAPAAVSAIDLVGGSAGVVPYQSATNTTLFTAVGTAGQAFLSGGTGSPTWGTLGISGGGTNSTATATAGGVGYGTGTAHAYTVAGTSGQILTSAGAGVPAWITTVPIANGGTNSTATPTAGGAVYGTGTAYAITAAGTAGQVLTSNGASAPTWGAASLTVSVVSGTTQTAVANTQYVLTNVAATTVTLPASPASGDTVWVTVANSLTTNVIARNAQTIMGLAEDLTINWGYSTVQLRFVNSSWRIL